MNPLALSLFALLGLAAVAEAGLLGRSPPNQVAMNVLQEIYPPGHQTTQHVGQHVPQAIYQEAFPPGHVAPYPAAYPAHHVPVPTYPAPQLHGAHPPVMVYPESHHELIHEEHGEASATASASGKGASAAAASATSGGRGNHHPAPVHQHHPAPVHQHHPAPVYQHHPAPVYQHQPASCLAPPCYGGLITQQPLVVQTKPSRFRLRRRNQHY